MSNIIRFPYQDIIQQDDQDEVIVNEYDLTIIRTSFIHISYNEYLEIGNSFSNKGNVFQYKNEIENGEYQVYKLSSKYSILGMFVLNGKQILAGYFGGRGFPSSQLSYFEQWKNHFQLFEEDVQKSVI